MYLFILLMFKLDFELDPTGYFIDAHKGESSSPNIRTLLEINVQWMLSVRLDSLLDDWKIIMNHVSI